MPPDEPKIATFKAKWDEEYRKRWGLENQFAEGLDPALVRGIEETCKRIYRLLTIDGYARIDLRLTEDNESISSRPIRIQFWPTMKILPSPRTKAG